ncbi:alanine--glyoxylate aminotransferase family protein [Alisedimentitalea sp. MJ-SS2]|uniref:pyridoxal-phosphate-dependent aminotransferase family protein n=1 Tax=Aliisedimentitalea sp. MJ-SS2 TaxID=3049795 RepID=UPI00290B6BAF|nr:alanine--glyoxylate aminotransferase family protein [Alisedimentitalea sp. MJ-SS2]MDU8928150.1 alanine--glyoxylate aminotransferase family protein [Alisedimentitalea sp. MJ-SS2]
MTDIFKAPERLLMGPGPSNTSAAVLAATAQPTIGHLDPDFQRMMEEVKDLMRYAMQTENPVTFPISAPASLAMEAGLVNLLEPGDTAIIAQNGVFGGRMADIVERCGAKCVLVETDWGKPIDLDKVAETIKAHPEAKLLGFVHAETSTGAESDAAALCQMAQEAGILTLMDTVTGLGGVPVRVDDWGVDITYSGTQKCLSVPPGLAPFSVSQRAIEAVQARTTKVQSWFTDLNLVLGYWSGGGGARSYHHTAPVNALYGMHEGLRLLKEEGLEAAWERHARCHRRLAVGLQGLGLEFVVDAPHRLPQLNSVWVPEGVDDATVRGTLLNEHGIEVGAGLGPFAGQVWRIGLMGDTAREDNVDRLLSALSVVLGRGLKAAE